MFELEGIDRMYLNAYVPLLQTPGAVAYFLRTHLGHRVASSVMLDPISKKFIRGIEEFAAAQDIPLITFGKDQRKEDIAAEARKAFGKPEGVVLIGKAQEKTRVFRTEKRTDAQGKKYPWLASSTAMVNHYYFYILDRDFGPLFIKFCSYFPYTAKVCLNGHEWLKQQLSACGVDFEPLDNGLLSCADVARAQELCKELDAEKIEAVFRKWLKRLPHPFTAEDRQAGYRYELSILQSEYSLTMVLDRPATGRAFFEQVIRENLDIGRPDQVQLIFNRRVARRTPVTFRTRVVTQGVIPSLHVSYKSSRIKQYFKEGRALRVETTINDARAFSIGKRLKNLPDLRKVGFEANRRLLDVQRVSHDCAVGEDVWNSVVRPITVGTQRASALRFDDPKVQALLLTLVMFATHINGFRSKDLREPLAQLLGIDRDHITRSRMTYDLRRLRLHGFIVRVPKSHRFQVTTQGLRIALFFTRTWSRLLRPGLSLIVPSSTENNSRLRRLFDGLLTEIQKEVETQNLAA